MSDPKNVKFSLKAMVNKEKTKVLFVEAGGDFVDVLLSFLTMPLGKLVKVLEKHYGVDQSPVVGSLTTLYKGFSNLHSDHFSTEGAKQMLLNPMSSFEDECRRLKLDITNTQLPEFFICERCGIRTHCVTMYHSVAWCIKCGTKITKLAREVKFEAGRVFVENMGTFVISDDLYVFPEVLDLMESIRILGIGDVDGAELMNVTFGANEIMSLLKASLSSPSPLSDVILNQKRQMIPPAIVKYENGTTSSNSTSKKMNLKVIVQKSSNKILYGRAGEDFVDFLCSFLTIPLGVIVGLLSRKSCFETINNLDKSTLVLIDGKFFKTPDMKTRFTRMKLAHGSISDSQILPFFEECLNMPNLSCAQTSNNFPKGQGKYVKGLQTYMVADDLTVTPFSISSTISVLSKLNIPLSDITEVELPIGLKEAYSILEASLSSKSVLSDALNINPTLMKQPKQENI